MHGLQLYYLVAIAKSGTILRGFCEIAALHFPLKACP